MVRSTGNPMHFLHESDVGQKSVARWLQPWKSANTPLIGETGGS